MRRALLSVIVALALAGCIPPGNGVYERAYRPPVDAAAPATNPLFSPGHYADSASDLLRLDVSADGDIWIPRFACGDLRLRFQRQASAEEVHAAGLQHRDPPAYLFRVVEYRAPTVPEAPCAVWLRAADHMLIQPLQINSSPQAAPFGNAMEARRVEDGEYAYEALFPQGSPDPVIRRLEP